MDTQSLAALEQAIAPYRRRGFVVTSQSEGSITLSQPPEKFSYLFFVTTLLLVWPVAVVYLISHNNRREKRVCFRITSQGQVEVSGYTLEIITKERRRRQFINILLVAVIAVIILLLLLRSYLSRM